mmetsp:Transcript_13134/g.28507  ORF Transcript_13134/g.28507 Transcript_13134/m.28507 type:complete len:757 (+) Transcript_13134:45-2315(+)
MSTPPPPPSSLLSTMSTASNGINIEAPSSDSVVVAAATDELTTEDATGPESNESEPPKADIDTIHASKMGRQSVVSLDNTPRKLVIHNVDKYIRPKQLEKLVASWIAEAEASPDAAIQGIKIDKTKKPQNKGWMHLWVEEESMVQPFLCLINDTNRVNKYGKTLVAKRHLDDQDTGGRERSKRSRDDESLSNDAKKTKVDEDDDCTGKPRTVDEIRDKLTPYWRKSYSDQLTKKKVELIKRSAIQIVKGVKARFRTLEKEARRSKRKQPPELYEWLKGKKGINIEDVLPSPQVVGYRNKSEFTFGHRNIKGVEGKDGGTSTRVPSVGFLPFGWKSDVASPHCLQNIPSEMCGIADVFNAFLIDCPLPPYQAGIHRGVWRTITIRSSARTGQIMIIVVHAPPEGAAGARECGSDAYSREVFEKERDRLVKMLTEGCIPMPPRDLPESPADSETGGNAEVVKDEKVTPALNAEEEGTISFKVTSIYFQEFDGLSHPTANHPVQHVYGKKHIEEVLGKNTFEISPGSFFQVTTRGAEVLYEEVADRVREVSINPAETLLLDVCCGTGTIGLHCMKEGVAGRVLGIDISEPAVEDAKANAIRNGFSDEAVTRFVASRAEHVLAEELQKDVVRGKPIVAVVDPARDGLHADVIRALRHNNEIQRLIYVSCNPTGSLVKDAGLLCAPPTKKYKGLPFKPTSAQPVDMFPLTPHCELVMTFDRMAGDAPVHEKMESEETIKADGDPNADIPGEAASSVEVNCK